MNEFAALIIVHFVAVITPGPEVLLVFKESISRGRAYAVWLSIGIGSGTLLHVAYSILGIGLLVSQSILLFNFIKYLGAIYLIYLGIMSFVSNGRDVEDRYQLAAESVADLTRFAIPQTFLKGFLVSAFNPKATLFFLSIFTVLINPETPLPIKIGYGFWMAIVNALCLSVISFLLNIKQVRGPISRLQSALERIAGALFLLFGIRLLFSSRS